VIVSTSHKNRRNKSLHARRRSIRKGQQEQLFAVVTELKGRQSLVVCEEFSPSRLNRYTRSSGKPCTNVLEAFAVNWGLYHYGFNNKAIVPYYKLDLKGTEYQPHLDRIQNDELKSDFKFILADLSLLVLGRGFDKTPHAYLAVFVGTNWLDVIASKNGNMAKHHFYHWQAVAAGAPAAVNTVDDASVEDDATLGEDED